MTRYTLITAALLLGLIPAALQAQTDPLAPATPPVAQAATAPSAGDLQALNFYIQQNDTASIEAELRRLRVKFPGWVPPTDLAKLKVTQPSVEVDTIYRQIAADQLAEARATIATTQAAHPDWVPASDMIKLLETAEGQLKLDAALDAGNASQALDIANNTDGLLRCDRVNNAWRIAKAQEAQQATAAAVGTYSAIVGACTSFPDISATLEESALAARLTILFSRKRSGSAVKLVNAAHSVVTSCVAVEDVAAGSTAAGGAASVVVRNPACASREKPTPSPRMPNLTGSLQQQSHDFPKRHLI